VGNRNRNLLTIAENLLAAYIKYQISINNVYIQPGEAIVIVKSYNIGLAWQWAI
jgi:hypothetical protein